VSVVAGKAQQQRRGPDRAAGPAGPSVSHAPPIVVEVYPQDRPPCCGVGGRAAFWSHAVVDRPLIDQEAAASASEAGLRRAHTVSRWLATVDFWSRKEPIAQALAPSDS